MNTFYRFWKLKQFEVGRSSQLPQCGRSSRRAFLLSFFAGLGVTLTVAACSPTTSTQAEAGSPASPIAANRVVRIGHQKFDPFTLVKARGGLEKRLEPLGVRVEWTEFQSGPPMLEALNVGSIDIGRTGDAPPIIAQAADAPLVYIGGSKPKDQSSAVLIKADSPIQTVADLKGKKVGYAKGSSAHYLIVRVLETAGLTLNDIESAYLAPADARSAFEQGGIDAWVIWDPFYAAAQEQMDVRVLRDSAGLVTNRDFYLAVDSYATENADVIEAIKQETQDVAAWADTNPDEVISILSPILGIEAPILDIVTKRRHYDFQPISSEMIAEQQQIADTFYEFDLIPKAITVSEIVWRSN
ncbi:MAG: sulfonate ABC transporter substrate-binding protein [Elainellaceae cyanobacterium]